MNGCGFVTDAGIRRLAVSFEDSGKPAPVSSPTNDQHVYMSTFSGLLMDKGAGYCKSLVILMATGTRVTQHLASYLNWIAHLPKLELLYTDKFAFYGSDSIFGFINSGLISHLSLE